VSPRALERARLSPGIRAAKRIARALFDVEMALRRRWARLRGRERYRLAGACGGCGKCCEAPSMQVPRAMFWFPSGLRAFAAWQRRVNGFRLTESDRQSGTLTFACDHFEWSTRRCTSYETRPGMCRDYPRLLLDQPWPDLFPECGFRAVAKDAPRLLEILERQQLSAEQREDLERKLFLK
jgi:Fe-S-cluster containining protein